MKMTVGSVAACLVLSLFAMAMWPDDSPAPRLSRAIAQESGQEMDPFGGDVGQQVDPAEEDEATRKASDLKRKKASAKAGVADAKSVSGEAAAEDSEPTTEDNNALTEQKLAKRMKTQYLQIPLTDTLAHFSEARDIEMFINQKHIQETGKDLSDPSWAIDIDFKSIRGDMLLDLMLRDVGLVYTIRDGIVVITTPDDLESTLEVRVYNCRDLVGLMHHGSPSAMGAEGMEGMGMGMGMGMGTFGGMSGSMSGQPAAGAGSISIPGMGATPGMPGMGMSAGSAMGGMPGMPGGYEGAMGPGMSGGPRMPGAEGGMRMGSAANRVPDLDALIHVITSTLMPDSWEETGGHGTIEAYYGGLLIVNNNPQAHRRIDKLLKMMRDAAKQPPGSVVGDK